MELKCSRRSFLGKSGFTLIELLVVVLIIGILAAVALPQYNKAVRKAHGAEALAALDALDKGLSAYYLEHGSYEGANAETLGITIPALTHFRYGTGYAYADGSSEFITGQTGSAGLYNYYVIRLLNPSSEEAINTMVDMTWSEGKPVRAQCLQVGTPGKTYPCEDYFKCHWDVRIFRPCADCSEVTDKKCYLK